MKRVAVLRGGPSDEYAVSMLSGNAVLKALRESDYPHKDIVITKKGEWLEEGFVKSPEKALEAIDVVFIALHGSYGEDGQVQRILQRKGIPFTGSRALASAIAFNKELTKNTMRPHGLLMPKHRRIHRAELDRLDEEIPHIFKEIGTELFVKPLTNGSSLGVRHIPNQAILKEALIELLGTYEQVLVEEYIRGREATVGVMNDFRNQPVYVLPVIEIIPPSGEPMFSHEHKYNGRTEEIVPGRFSYHEKAKLSEAAALVHKIIACEHYSRSDFIVRDGEVYFLEINTLPGLTSESLFPKAAAAVGLNFTDFITHLIEIAHVQNRY
jgi:D-alanine-D-alanine ligase